MHRVLRIQETLGVIAANLPRRADLVAMGVSCRTFFDPAMDELWRDISSLAQLVKCLPQECWEILDTNYGPAVRIKSPPSLEQWERVRQYARRVRVLKSSARDVARRSCRLLCHHFPEPWLFRNLQKCSIVGEAATRELICLMQPTLESLHYTVDSQGYAHTWRMDLVISRAPDLEVLRLDSFYQVDSESAELLHVFPPRQGPVLSGVVLSLPRLTAVDFATTFESGTVLHLSRLPNLSRVGIVLDDTNHTPLVKTEDGCPFPALEFLQIGATEAKYLIQWLRPLRLPLLTKLHISISTLSSLNLAKELLRVVVEFPRLTSLRLQFGDPSSVDYYYSVLAGENSLKILLEKLPLIEEFYLDGFPFNPSRQFLDALTLAWPRLRRLTLGPDCCLDPPETSRIQLGDTLLFNLRCPKMEYITLPFSPSVSWQSIWPREVPASLNFTPGPRFDLCIYTNFWPQAWSPEFPDRVISPRRLMASNLRVLKITEPFDPKHVNCAAAFIADAFPHARVSYHLPATDGSLDEVLKAQMEEINEKIELLVEQNKTYDAFFGVEVL